MTAEKFYPMPSEELEWRDANEDQPEKLETKTHDGYDLTLEQGNHWYITGDQHGWSWPPSRHSRRVELTHMSKWGPKGEGFYRVKRWLDKILWSGSVAAAKNHSREIPK